MLPKLPRYGVKRQITALGGLDRRPGAAEGTLAAAENLSAEDYPVLRPRRGRTVLCQLNDTPNGLFACGETLFWCDGTGLYANGTPVSRADGGAAALTDTPKRFCALGERVVIWPDKVLVRREDPSVTPQSGATAPLAGEPGELEEEGEGDDPSSAADAAPSPQGEGQGEDPSVTPQSGATAPLAGEPGDSEEGGAIRGSRPTGTEEEDGATAPLAGEPGAWVLEALEASVTVSATFADGTYAGEAAEGNTILAADGAFDWGSYFRVGDAVTVSGAADAENDKTIIVREIDGPALRFYEFSFTVNATAADISVARTVPELDFLCSDANRVWGCKGDTVYASKLGDPFNWNVYDGLASDSWTAALGSAGDFTGCCVYLGYPCFFKEQQVCKVYGSRPANFELLASATLGVVPGAGDSLAVAGETLYYLRRAGIVAYGGGVPARAGDALCAERAAAGAAGSDGERYFVSLRTGEGWGLYALDPRRGLWLREDATEAVAWAWWDGVLCCLDRTGALWQVGDAAHAALPAPAGTPETVRSVAEFNDFTDRTLDRKHPTRLRLRLELDAGAALRIALQYDGDGVWRDECVLAPGGKRTVAVPLLPRRCDHYRVRLAGEGGWKLWELARENTVNRKSGSNE